MDSILGDVAGFASMPASHGTDTDGIFIERQFLDTTNLDNDINVLVHEMGHYLGLFHTFGLCEETTVGVGYDCSCDNNNCLFNGDMVCDTPPNVMQMDGYTATDFPDTCLTDAIPYTPNNGPNLNTITANIDDPKENYMDYGEWAWQYRFTDGQITRMQFMIDPEYGPRKSLLGQAACEDCHLMNNCTFTINTSPALTAPRNEIVQTGTTTPSVQFSISSTCIATLGTQLSFSWTLESLGTINAVVATDTTPQYTTLSTLAVGN